MISWTDLFPLVVEALLLVVASLVVFDGVRRLVRDGLSRWPALMVALGLILPVVVGSNNLQVVKSVQRAQVQKLAAVNVYGREPDVGWEKAPLTPELRTSMSTRAAEVNYTLLGKRVEIIDEHGTRVPYAPSPAVQTQREQMLRSEKGAEAAAEAAVDRGVGVFTSTAGFLLAGLVVGVWQRRRQ